MDVFTNKVLTLAAQKRWADALAACDRQISAAAESKPAQAIVYFVQGQIHKAQNDIKRAEAAFKATLDASPNYIQAYYELARIYLKEKRTEEAVVPI